MVCDQNICCLQPCEVEITKSTQAVLYIGLGWVTVHSSITMVSVTEPIIEKH